MHQRNTPWVFPGAAALFFLIIVFQARSLYQQSLAALSKTNRAEETLRTLEDVKTEVRSWETYNRFRTRSGQDTAFGAELAAAGTAARRHLQAFTSLSQGDALQQQRAATLQRLLDERFKSRLENPAGIDTRIETTLARLEDTQTALFSASAQAFERSSRRRYAFSITGFVLLTLFGVVILLRGRRLADRRAKAEEEARLAEARYRLLLENSDLALVVLDADKRIKFLGNSALVERTTGYTLDQILGEQWPFPLPEPGPGSERRSHEYQATMADGSERWMAYRVNTLLEEDDTVAEHQIVTWDVDTEKRMTLERDAANEARERERSMLQDVIDQLPNIVYVKDLDGRYVLINSKTRELFGGITQDQLLGHTLHEVGYNRATNEHFIDLDNLVRLEKKVLAAEEEHWVRGERRWYYIVKFPIFDSDGTLCYLGGVSTDITELKSKEQALVTANHEAEVARSGQEAFLAAISHELRTPLNGIMGMTNLLVGTPLSEEQHDYADTILASARNLLALINDLLDFSKIKAGKFTFERQPFRVRHTVRKAIYPLQFKAEQKGIGLTVDFDDSLPQVLVGDALRLSQILINLVSNAVKFTARGEVVLRLAGESVGDVVVVRVSVQDTGIGIPADKLQYIFESFAQNTSGTSRQYGGTGLGLAIVKQLVELQGGTIWVESTPGEGSTFFATVPFEIGTEKSSPVPGADASPALQAAPTLQGLTILVAEDNPINQKVARTTLEKAGAEVTVVENGLLALEALSEAEGGYDVVLLDLQMPEMDGFAAARAISKRWGAAVPMVAMTADALKGEAERCKQAGMVGFVSKPFEPAELYQQLLAAVRTNRRPFAAPTQPETPPPSAQPAPQGPAIDLSYVEDLSGGDPSYIAELLRIFLANTPPVMEQLRVLLQEGGDPKEVHRLAHQLKSSFGIVRLPGVLETLQALETAARGAAFAHDDWRPRFESVYDTLQQAMPQLLALRDGTA